MTTVMYGTENTFLYYLVSAEGKLSIAPTTIQWASVGTGDPVQVWFEPEKSGATEVHVGDNLYIAGNSRGVLKHYLVKRPVGESLKWSDVRSDLFTIHADGLSKGDPLPVGTPITLGDRGDYVGLGDNNYLELKDDALEFQVTMTS